MKRILSLGAGVNSTAILALHKQGKIHLDGAFYAKVPDLPETDLYLTEVIEPFCSKQNLPLDIIQRDGPSLYEKHMIDRLIPSRMFGACRDKWKIQTANKWLKNKFPNEKVETVIGFDAGEKERQLGFEKIGKKALFPLIDLGIDREGCKREIKKVGLPVPIKSGCFCCPHQPMRKWIELYKKHPDLYAKAEELEKNGKGYPKIVLPYNYNLTLLRKMIKAWDNQEPEYAQQLLANFHCEQQATCACMG